MDERFGAGEVQSLVDSLDPDIEWQLPAMDNLPFAGTWQGREGVRQFLHSLTETQEVIEFRPDQFVANDNTVIVLGRFLMRVKATGRDSVSDRAHVWTIADGKVTRFREYVDTAAVSKAHRASRTGPDTGTRDEKNRTASVSMRVTMALVEHRAH